MMSCQAGFVAAPVYCGQSCALSSAVSRRRAGSGLSKGLRPARSAVSMLAAGTRLPEVGEVSSADAMEFFNNREGTWESWRVTHHLAFRRDETGMSDITMKCLAADDEKIVALCADHGVDPATACGGCYVTWVATLAWDEEGENHEGSTTFALIPDQDDTRKGKILRDRGYAEIVQISGDYFLDDDDGLNLVTPYDGGEVVERFSFDGPDVVNRVSTVRRFGGLATATFATERRKGTQAPHFDGDIGELDQFSLFNGVPSGVLVEEPQPKAPNAYARPPQPPPGPPSSGSAFSTGFSGSSTSSTPARSQPGSVPLDNN